MRVIVLRMKKPVPTLTQAQPAGRGVSGTTKKKGLGGSAQAFEKARFGQGNPRISKPFPLKNSAPAWLDFAGFG
jgi:hypothetical protein